MTITNELKDKLITWYAQDDIKNPKKFIDKYSYWHNEGSEVINEFIEILNGNKEPGGFSWIKSIEKIGNKEKLGTVPNNVKYGIPIQVSGDFDNAIVYHCLLNAGTVLKDDDSNQYKNVLEYYKKGKSSSDPTINFYSKISEQNKLNKANIADFIINEENKFTEELKKIKEYIQTNDYDKESLKMFIRENCYYVFQYYKTLVSSSINDFINLIIDSDFIENQKLCNLECTSFRSHTGIGVGEILKTPNYVDRLSSLIILRRIAKYEHSLKSSHNDLMSPLFIFRSKRDWMKRIKEALSYINIYSDDEINQVLQYLDMKYFASLNSRSGAISKNNLSKFTKIRSEYDKTFDIEKYFKLFSNQKGRN